MSDIFKSALGYFGSSEGNFNNDYVGHEIEVNGKHLKVKKLIAEGGFAFVYVVQEISTGSLYALKRLLAVDKAACDPINLEINITKQLSGHPYITSFHGLTFIDKLQSSLGKYEFLILLELCTGGSLIDTLKLMEGTSLSVQQICSIVFQTTKAVQHMQTQDPQIIHRDLKIENLLISDSRYIKLCDFGSATVKSYIIDNSWSANQRGLLEEEMAAHTTPMYRAPEMLDLWNNYPINLQADIWALGCILYYLCYLKHPFEDSSKLRIINGNYSIPAKDAKYECFHELIRGMLKVNPEERFKVGDILERLAAIAETKGFDMKAPLDVKMKKIDVSTPVHQLYSNGHLNEVKPSSQPTLSHSPIPQRSPLPQRPPPLPPAAGAGPLSGGSLFSSIKGYSAVLEGQHAGHYLIYNLSGRRYSSAKFNARIVEANWHPTKAPTLGSLYNLAVSVNDFLGNNPKNIAVIHCLDGRSSSAMLVCAFLTMVHVFNSPEQALNMFAIKRCPPGLQPSQLRYLNYIKNLTLSPQILPHFKPVTIASVMLSPIPLFTQKRDGLRPYLEVYQGDHKMLVTLQDFDSMHLYLAEENRVTLPVNMHFVGDVTIFIFHARRMVSKLMGIKVAQIQFHTGFISEEDTSLKFYLKDIDDVSEPSLFPNNFVLTINLLVSDTERTPPHPPPWISKSVDSSLQPIKAFSSVLEMDETKEKFGSVHSSPVIPKKNIGPKPPMPKPPPCVQPDIESVLPSHKPMDNIGKNSSEPDICESHSSKPLKESDLLNWEGSAPDITQVPNNVDLLNIDVDSSGMKKDPSNFDLLSGIADAQVSSNSSNKNENVFDLLGGDSHFAVNKNTSLDSGGPDLLGNFKVTNTQQNSGAYSNINSSGNVGSSVSSINQLRSSPVTVNLQQNPLSQPSKPSDPFADLGNISGMTGWGGPKAASPLGGTPIGGTPIGGSTPILGSPQHQATNNAGSWMPMGGTTGTRLGQNSNRMTVSGSAGMGTFAAPTTGTAKSPSGTPHHQMKSPQSNYSRSNFDSAKPPPANKKTGNYAFEDLLGSQGFSFASSKDSGPKTMAEMKKEEITKNMDPEKLVVFQWTDGEKKNIRTLLCSLHTILWDGAKWNECGMHQLVHLNEVKKMYRKACLAVHPDKLAGTEHESLAKLIFMELNDAYSEFENDPNQQEIFK